MLFYHLNKLIEVIELGLIDYKNGWSIQELCYHNIVNLKKKGQKPTPNYLIFCEHFPVYTLGRSSPSEQLFVDSAILKAQTIPLYAVNRGGGITYHGPGQLVVYPIIDLENFFTDIHRYLRLLESVVIDMLAYFHISSTTIPGLTGVWLSEDPNNNLLDRKICAMGVRVSRWVTMHGLALNVNNDLTPFNQIIPCGLSKQVTSMQTELQRALPLAVVADVLKAMLIKKLMDEGSL
ncbi:MAG: lipoyl(octanoyl) transferase LipB [Amoebophilaceae bacterium]|nr:lipoyl(octanoyl) transferase LipB [Amoebophilaceae bacterium]